MAGPAEATAIGNVMMQAYAAGRVSSLAEMRRMIARCVPTEPFCPETRRCGTLPMKDSKPCLREWLPAGIKSSINLIIEKKIDTMKQDQIIKAYEAAKARYAETGVDTDAALAALQRISLSLHCWQTDDVTGFENPDGQLTGGIQATGNYPGKARNIDEVRADIEKAKSLIPGRHRLSLHAIYGDFKGKKVDRDQIEPEHFQSWIDWARANDMKLDFNSTSFSHPKSGDLSLANPDKAVRDFWVEHTVRSRRIADEMGRQLGSKACHNIWVHDGSKDLTVNRYYYRSLLRESLDRVFEHKCPNVKDAVECKLFGTGLESFTVGSHEFYMGYAVSRGLMATLDMGHFHPTEEVSDKISSMLLFSPESCSMSAVRCAGTATMW